MLPSDVEVTVLADRGFGDVALYELLDRLSFGYLIRFRGVVHVESAGGEVRKAKEWVPPTHLIKGVVESLKEGAGRQRLSGERDVVGEGRCLCAGPRRHLGHRGRHQGHLALAL
ncbi:hypothetical protein KGD87_19815 [Myxococcus sp. SDU36]|nr:hypothetical protein KGD87_19815 [Myxococcus sp. SDU36]